MLNLGLNIPKQDLIKPSIILILHRVSLQLAMSSIKFILNPKSNKFIHNPKYSPLNLSFTTPTTLIILKNKFNMSPFSLRITFPIISSHLKFLKFTKRVEPSLLPLVTR